MKLSRWEQRTLTALLDAMIPATTRTEPGLADLDLAAFWQRFEASAPALMRFGLRSAIWGLGGGSGLLLGRRATFLELAADERERVLERAAASRLYPLRQMVVLLKIVACMAYFDDGEVQARTRGEVAP